MTNEPPKCPNCSADMVKVKNGLYECPNCGGTYIPSDVTGVFTPCSVIGIHKKGST